MKQIDDSIREGDVIIETSGNGLPRINFYN